MTITSNQTQACLEAWINCENLLVNISTLKSSLSRKLTNVVDECALICMGTFHALKSRSKNLSKIALLCVGICEECAELCESQSEEPFRTCAKTCRECSEKMTMLAFE